MKPSSNLAYFKELAQNYTVLCVEDNAILLDRLVSFLNRFFKNILTAKDGKEGLEVFKKNRPDLIISDIHMPNISGLDMIKHIKEIDTNVPVIIMSAYDEKQYLLDSIKHGVVDYMIKPVAIADLSKTIINVLEKIKGSSDKDIFNYYMRDAFDHQHNLIVLYENMEPVFANPAFLNFFDVESVKEFVDKKGDIFQYFQEHHGFLYQEQKDENCLKNICDGQDSYYHVKMADLDLQAHHFLLKYKYIEEKSGYSLFVFDDITPLNLLSLFDDNKEPKEEINEDAMEQFVNLLVERKIDVKINNFYKGLSVINPAQVIKYEDDKIYLKTSYNQLRAIKIEKNLVVSTAAISKFVFCDEIVKIDYDKQLIVATKLRFVNTSPVQRKNVRVEVQEDCSLGFTYKNQDYNEHIEIVDISIDAIKVKMSFLPFGIEANESSSISVELDKAKEKIAFKCKSKILRVDKGQNSYMIVFALDLEPNSKKQLLEFISINQIRLIREFKALK